MARGAFTSDHARHLLARRLDVAVQGLADPTTPMVVVDLDAFDANATDLVRRAAGKPLRKVHRSSACPSCFNPGISARHNHRPAPVLLRVCLDIV